ncbi:MAG: sugar-transfer associated ATP-grasp domain-containing protein [Spirochaetaceae bacterium]|nr:sugar-transfer associated ATP-grasp domain-containing protein [Spirochaetaceae bacterium]MDT8297497.1 sugar-transfer associated ATP-grasp domain-containing protein [Spirochaetaceae bacterium]
MKRNPRLFESLLGLNARNLDYVYPHNPRRYFPQVDDKIKSKEILLNNGIPVPETLGICDSFVTLESTMETIDKLDTFVMKPSKGRAGGGILLLTKESPGMWRTPSGKPKRRSDIETHIGEILFGVYSFGGSDDRVLMEKLIVPDEFFREIYRGGVADIRVILFRNRPVMAMARIPTSRSEGKANLHQGAVGIGIDIQDGVFTTAALKGRVIEVHPDTQIPLPGRIIPSWKDVVRIATEASRSVDLGYLGVDVVLDEHEGPLILELNARPGLEIQSVNRKGLSDELIRVKS